MTVTYIFHSGFLVETPSAVLIFDYFKDPAGVVDSLDDTGKTVYFIASHRHPDHFVPQIFTIGKRFASHKFLLSHEIEKCAAYRRHAPKTDPDFHPVFLYRGDTFDDGTLRLQAFPSTDIGISSLASTDGLKIFHAGDLNLWQWKDAAPAEAVKMARGQFLACLRDIKASGVTNIDAAMYPVDPRQGNGYEDGARIFVDTFKVKHFFPMHFWDDPAKATDFAAYRNETFGEYHALTEPSDKAIIK